VPLKITENDAPVFKWVSVGNSWTGRQLAALTGRRESNMRRRLAQLVKAGLLTSSPKTTSGPGRPEQSYYLTTANVRKLQRLAPWIDVTPSDPKKVSALPHHAWINEFWLSLEVALRGQDYYLQRFFPSYRYDPSDESAPTFIAAPNRRQRTPSEKTVASDFALALNCPAGSSLAYGEIDLGTEILDSPLQTRATLLSKLEAYAAFHDSDGYRRLGDQLGQSFDGFRVLIATNSPGRLSNIRHLCASLGSSDFIWITTLDRITPESILCPIWQTGETETPRPLLRDYQGKASGDAAAGRNEE